LIDFGPPVIHKCNNCDAEMAVVNNGSDHVIAINCPKCWEQWKKKDEKKKNEN